MAQYLLCIGQRADIAFGLLVIFKQLDGKIAGRVAVAQIGSLLQVLLDFLDAMFYLVAVVDVHMAVVRVVVLVALIHADDGLEEFLHTTAVGEDGGHHGHTEEASQAVGVDMVASLLGLVKHVEGAHHAHVHVYELGGEIEVALQVAAVYHVDDDIGRLVDYLSAHVDFFRRIGRQRIGAGQVDDMEGVAVHLCHALLGVYRHATVVAHMLMGTRDEIEERCLAAVGVSHERHIDVVALADGSVFQLLVGGSAGGVGVCACVGFYFGLDIGLCLGDLSGGNHLNLVGLAMAQRNLISHNTVFHRVVERRIEQHLHFLALDKSHFYDAFAKAAVSKHFDDNAFLTGFKF